MYGVSLSTDRGDAHHARMQQLFTKMDDQIGQWRQQFGGNGTGNNRSSALPSTATTPMSSGGHYHGVPSSRPVGSAAGPSSAVTGFSYDYAATAGGGSTQRPSTARTPFVQYRSHPTRGDGAASRYALNGGVSTIKGDRRLGGPTANIHDPAHAHRGAIDEPTTSVYESSSTGIENSFLRDGIGGFGHEQNGGGEEQLTDGRDSNHQINNNGKKVNEAFQNLPTGHVVKDELRELRSLIEDLQQKNVVIASELIAVKGEIRNKNAEFADLREEQRKLSTSFEALSAGFTVTQQDNVEMKRRIDTMERLFCSRMPSGERLTAQAIFGRGYVPMTTSRAPDQHHNYRDSESDSLHEEDDYKIHNSKGNVRRARNEHDHHGPVSPAAMVSSLSIQVNRNTASMDVIDEKLVLVDSRLAILEKQLTDERVDRQRAIDEAVATAVDYASIGLRKDIEKASEIAARIAISEELQHSNLQLRESHPHQHRHAATLSSCVAGLSSGRHAEYLRTSPTLRQGAGASPTSTALKRHINEVSAERIAGLSDEDLASYERLAARDYPYNYPYGGGAMTRDGMMADVDLGIGPGVAEMAAMRGEAQLSGNNHHYEDESVQNRIRATPIPLDPRFITMNAPDVDLSHKGLSARSTPQEAQLYRDRSVEHEYSLIHSSTKSKDRVSPSPYRGLVQGHQLPAKATSPNPPTPMPNSTSLYTRPSPEQLQNSHDTYQTEMDRLDRQRTRRSESLRLQREEEALAFEREMRDQRLRLEREMKVREEERQAIADRHEQEQKAQDEARARQAAEIQERFNKARLAHEEAIKDQRAKAERERQLIIDAHRRALLGELVASSVEDPSPFVVPREEKDANKNALLEHEKSGTTPSNNNITNKSSASYLITDGTNNNNNNNNNNASAMGNQTMTGIYRSSIVLDETNNNNTTITTTRDTSGLLFGHDNATNVDANVSRDSRHQPYSLIASETLHGDEGPLRARTHDESSIGKHHQQQMNTMNYSRTTDKTNSILYDTMAALEEALGDESAASSSPSESAGRSVNNVVALPIGSSPFGKANTHQQDNESGKARITVDSAASFRKEEKGDGDRDGKRFVFDNSNTTNDDNKSKANTATAATSNAPQKKESIIKGALPSSSLSSSLTADGSTAYGGEGSGVPERTDSALDGAPRRKLDQVAPISYQPNSDEREKQHDVEKSSNNVLFSSSARGGSQEESSSSPTSVTLAKEDESEMARRYGHRDTLGASPSAGARGLSNQRRNEGDGDSDQEEGRGGATLREFKMMTGGQQGGRKVVSVTDEGRLDNAKKIKQQKLLGLGGGGGGEGSSSNDEGDRRGGLQQGLQQHTNINCTESPSAATKQKIHGALFYSKDSDDDSDEGDRKAAVGFSRVSHTTPSPSAATSAKRRGPPLRIGMIGGESDRGGRGDEDSDKKGGGSDGLRKDDKDDGAREVVRRDDTNDQSGTEGENSASGSGSHVSPSLSSARGRGLGGTLSGGQMGMGVGASTSPRSGGGLVMGGGIMGGRRPASRQQTLASLGGGGGSLANTFGSLNLNLGASTNGGRSKQMVMKGSLLDSEDDEDEGEDVSGEESNANRGGIVGTQSAQSRTPSPQATRGASALMRKVGNNDFSDDSY